MNSRISVIIPVKNDETRIEKCLKAVFSQTLQPHEVLLIDGHSTDHTIEKAQEFPVKIVYENYGTVGGARQTGIESANGEYIAFTDSDCIPEKNWLEMLIEEFKPGIVGVGGGIKNIGEGIWEKSIAIALDSFLGSANSVQDRMIPKPRFVRSISGCNSSYRKTDVEKAGGFNVSYRFNEDTDLNKRLSTFGMILYTPSAVVLHDQSRNLKQFAKRMFQFGEGRAKSRILDIQILPPLSLLFIIPCLFVAPLIFLGLIGLYAIIIFVFSFFLAVKGKNVLFCFTVPVIFLFEHSMYAMGFWLGVFRILISDVK